MATKKAASRGSAPAAEAEPTKAELQRRMEEAREDISQTVEEIKDTVTEQYENVKETVSDALDWREQFRKHTAALSLGALAVGYVVGSSIASSLVDTTKKRGRKSGGLIDEIYTVAENLSDQFSDIAQTVLLPALGKKIKDTFGVDISDKLHALVPAKRATAASKRTTKKSSAKKAVAKKAGAKKSVARKGAAKKSR
ncbi:MAG TPA: hypothetical protein VM095_09610 [Pyrinomonadaceae bacterium]|nr:hypothetical protein [Pyrinomonadaceae bacterium]